MDRENAIQRLVKATQWLIDNHQREGKSRSGTLLVSAKTRGFRLGHTGVRFGNSPQNGSITLIDQADPESHIDHIPVSPVRPDSSHPALGNGDFVDMRLLRQFSDAKLERMVRNADRVMEDNR